MLAGNSGAAHSGANEISVNRAILAQLCDGKAQRREA